MAPSTDIRIRSVSFDRERIGYRSPIKFGGRVVTDAVLFNVRLEVETRNGIVGQGLGSMPMGNVWAWPSNVVSTEQTLAALLRFAELATLAAEKLGTYAHPLDLTRALAADHAAIAQQVETELALAEPMPVLAQLVAASPLEAAIHDAQGKALKQNSYNLLGKEFCSHDLAHYLSPEFAGEYLDRYTSRQPQAKMPLYHLVGALDPLTFDDVVQQISDGLPETLGEWIVTDGLTHLKIKLNGDDLAWDVARVVAIEKVAATTQATLGVTKWNYSLDFNERCAHVDYLLEFLRKVEELSPAAMSRVQYIEQPTHRDLRKHPENKMHAVAKIKPVVIDESLVDFESLLLAQEQGYSGVALKACKGHTEALLMGAAAQKHGLFLCVQDLSCPGYSFLHSASLAARIPTIAAIEGNGRQYCPAGNELLGNVYPSMFHITDGTVGTGVLDGIGLGF
ncbi:transmembrane prediction [Pirellula staleyi DSM 6068]|uniref:Transmembrane prediction n=1 Tax=Pirellula staleyi (strain ATCC 27377 / DSM 6068 / ICPB 4128) TaxID=530564 RepID=D2R1Z2_PIRSD|nr:mandelate racemase/muconate lactonizing enzyme family protein [Pirellula staleyi]ADB18603.1 transmembrane prediction [Pirellula staleyi DSM 6068]